MNNQFFKITLLTLVLLLAGAASAAQAATLTVTNTNDSGAGSLRQAIINAAAGDTIVFDSSVFSTPQTINLTTSDFTPSGGRAGLFINKSLTIVGPGARLLTVRRNSTTQFGIFANSGRPTRISGITVSNGNASIFGGSFDNFGGTLVLDGVTVTGDVSTESAVSVENGSTTTIINSTITGNSSVPVVGESGTINIANTTISGNNDIRQGLGAVYFFDTLGNLNLNNVTIANNQPFGVNNGGGTINVRNTIIAGNRQDIAGAFVSNGNNLIGSTTGGSGFTQPTDKTNVAANLAPLANNGGQTNTHLPNTGSPAIDAGNNCVVNLSCGANNPPVALTTDQRGSPFARQSRGTVDIGAVEVQAPTAATVSVGGRVMTASGRGITNVRISLTDSEGNVRTATTTTFGYYHFEDVAAGETYVINARGKRYSFSQPLQVLSVSDETTNVNFIAYPN